MVEILSVIRDMFMTLCVLYSASGGMFVQYLKFVQEYSGDVFDISVYSQEFNPTTWKLAKMNMDIRE